MSALGVVITGRLAAVPVRGVDGMSAACGCRPGTYDNGWHESRSAVCREAERQQWRRAMALVPQIVAEIRARTR